MGRLRARVHGFAVDVVEDALTHRFDASLPLRGGQLDAAPFKDGARCFGHVLAAEGGHEVFHRGSLALTGVVKDVFDGHEVVEVDRCGVFSKSLNHIRVKQHFVALSVVLPARDNRVVEGDHARSPLHSSMGLSRSICLLTAARSSTL